MILGGDGVVCGKASEPIGAKVSNAERHKTAQYITTYAIHYQFNTR
jgi:hypothetical protein